MNTLEKIKQQLKEDIVQRFVYGFLFFFWAWLNMNEGLERITYENNDYVYYFWMFVIPESILIAQVVRNSLLGWKLLIISFIIYFLIILGSYAYQVIQYYKFITLESHIIAFVFFVVMAFICLTIYYMRPAAPVNHNKKKSV